MSNDSFSSLLQPINDRDMDLYVQLRKHVCLIQHTRGYMLHKVNLMKEIDRLSLINGGRHIFLLPLFFLVLGKHKLPFQRWFFVCPIQQQQAHLWCVIYKLTWVVTLKMKTFYTSKKENFYDLSYIHLTMYYKPFIKRLYLTKIGSHTHPHIYKTCHIFPASY